MERKTKTPKPHALVLGCLALLVGVFGFSGAAMAADPVDAQYDDTVEQVEDQVGAGGGAGGGSGDASSDASGTSQTASTSAGEKSIGVLPLTGSDLLILIVVAGSLASVGLALRRLSA